MGRHERSFDFFRGGDCGAADFALRLSPLRFPLVAVCTMEPCSKQTPEIFMVQLEFLINVFEKLGYTVPVRKRSD